MRSGQHIDLATLKISLNALMAKVVEKEKEAVGNDKLLSLREDIVMRDGQREIVELLKILNEPAAELNSKLTILLTNRWEVIKGTYLSYTSVPDAEVTRACCHVANYLADVTGQDSLKLLIPTVQFKEDYLNNIDLTNELLENIIRFHILSEDFASLIPIRSLTFVDIGSTLESLLVNPFVLNDQGKMIPLTANEKERLLHHSSEIEELIAAKKSFEDSTDKTLYAEISRLIAGLRKGGEHGLTGGDEDSAGVSAYQAMINFREYWALLSNKLKEQAFQISPDFKSVMELKILNLEFDDCVEILAKELDMIRNQNRDAFTKIHLDAAQSVELSMAYRDVFFRVRSNLESFFNEEKKLHYVYSGHDNLALSLKQIEDLVDMESIRSVEDLVLIIKHLKPDEITNLFNNNLENILECVKSLNDLITVLLNINSQQGESVIKFLEIDFGQSIDIDEYSLANGVNLLTDEMASVLLSITLNSGLTHAFDRVLDEGQELSESKSAVVDNLFKNNKIPRTKLTNAALIKLLNDTDPVLEFNNVYQEIDADDRFKQLMTSPDHLKQLYHSDKMNTLNDTQYISMMNNLVKHNPLAFLYLQASDLSETKRALHKRILREQLADPEKFEALKLSIISIRQIVRFGLDHESFKLLYDALGKYFLNSITFEKDVIDKPIQEGILINIIETTKPLSPAVFIAILSFYSDPADRFRVFEKLILGISEGSSISMTDTGIYQVCALFPPKKAELVKEKFQNINRLKHYRLLNPTELKEALIAFCKQPGLSEQTDDFFDNDDFMDRVKSGITDMRYFDAFEKEDMAQLGIHLRHRIYPLINETNIDNFVNNFDDTTVITYFAKRFEAEPKLDLQFQEIDEEDLDSQNERELQSTPRTAIVRQPMTLADNYIASLDLPKLVKFLNKFPDVNDKVLIYQKFRLSNPNLSKFAPFDPALLWNAVQVPISYVDYFRLTGIATLESFNSDTLYALDNSGERLQYLRTLPKHTLENALNDPFALEVIAGFLAPVDKPKLAELLSENFFVNMFSKQTLISSALVDVIPDLLITYFKPVIDNTDNDETIRFKIKNLVFRNSGEILKFLSLFDNPEDRDKLFKLPIFQEIIATVNFTTDDINKLKTALPSSDISEINIFFATVALAHQLERLLSHAKPEALNFIKHSAPKTLERLLQLNPRIHQLNPFTTIDETFAFISGLSTDQSKVILEFARKSLCDFTITNYHVFNALNADQVVLALYVIALQNPKMLLKLDPAKLSRENRAMVASAIDSVLSNSISLNYLKFSLTLYDIQSFPAMRVESNFIKKLYDSLGHDFLLSKFYREGDYNQLMNQAQHLPTRLFAYFIQDIKKPESADILSRLYFEDEESLIEILSIYDDPADRLNFFNRFDIRLQFNIHSSSIDSVVRLFPDDKAGPVREALTNIAAFRVIANDSEFRKAFIAFCKNPGITTDYIDYMARNSDLLIMIRYSFREMEDFAELDKETISVLGNYVVVNQSAKDESNLSELSTSNISSLLGIASVPNADMSDPSIRESKSAKSKATSNNDLSTSLDLDEVIDNTPDDDNKQLSDDSKFKNIR